jgi:hypothetical protein
MVVVMAEPSGLRNAQHFDPDGCIIIHRRRLVPAPFGGKAPA